MWRRRWWTPAVALAIGVIVFAAFAAAGEWADAAKGFGVMALVAAIFAVGTRSETLQGLGGPGRDERWAAIDLRASALAGAVTMLVVVGAWLWEVAHGRDGSPYGQLAIVGAVSYVSAVAFLRWRG